MKNRAIFVCILSFYLFAPPVHAGPLKAVKNAAVMAVGGLAIICAGGLLITSMDKYYRQPSLPLEEVKILAKDNVAHTSHGDYYREYHSN